LFVCMFGGSHGCVPCVFVCAAGFVCLLIAWFGCFFSAPASASVVAIALEDAEAQTAEYPRVPLEYPRVRLEYR
jgi:hypothetical protein